MKRILVIDESEMVRETLALILGRSFVVVKKPFGQGALSFENTEQGVDLLILGITPAFMAEASKLLSFAMQAPFAVLFLVDSKSAARVIEDSERIGCLTKPFNPYELKEKVGRLLARRPVLRDLWSPVRDDREEKFTRYVAFPYLTRSAATLVHRFAASRMPILISGEIGCGQDRVARAIRVLQGSLALRLVLNGAEIGREYLAEKTREISAGRAAGESELSLLVESVDSMTRSAQSLLLEYLERAEERFDRTQVIATTHSDLAEKLYRGELLEGLYRRLATLTLKLTPLRERPEDIDALAAWFARDYAKNLGLSDAGFSSGALKRLKNYLWFGNLAEMETVIARTLTIRGTPRIEASDLIFDFTDQDSMIDAAESEDRSSPPPEAKSELKLVSAGAASSSGSSTAPVSDNGRSHFLELSTVIHELAHELKNPMVTIKTFAQLLADRYDDEHFRSRFRDVVGHDIDRMDELLESMVEFADFSQPRKSVVSLEQKLRSTLNEIASECAKHDARFRWKGDGYGRDVSSDEAQIKYIFKNVLLAVLSQVRKGSEIELDVAEQGCVTISFSRELARLASITPYLAILRTADENALPLRILLAKHVAEKNGGRMVVDQSDNDKDVLRMEFPIA